MTANTPTARTRRTPGPVLAAAVLLGFFGCLIGAALVLLAVLQAGDGEAVAPLAFFGMLFLLATIPVVIGLVKRHRGAQIVAAVLGAIWCVGGLASISTESTSPLAGIVSAAIGAAIALLVVVPMSAREWFAR